MISDKHNRRGTRKFFRGVRFFAFLAGLLAANSFVTSAQTTTNNSPPPVTARDFFNAGTKLLAAKKLSDAEKMLESSLAAQDESVQPLAEFNLGHVRFADGVEILKKGPDAQKVVAQGGGALADADQALQAGENSLAENQVDKMVTAYIEGRGARHELRAAEKAVKAAMESCGKTLQKWQRADDDFKGAAELNPADANAKRNAQIVEQNIAKLVDMIRKMQEMLGQMAGKKDQLGKMLSKLKGQIPGPDAPPGGKGDDDEDDKKDGGGQGEVKPESLTGKEEHGERNGDQMQAPLSPEQAAQMLDGISLDASKRLPMGGDQEGAPMKDRKGRIW